MELQLSNVAVLVEQLRQTLRMLFSQLLFSQRSAGLSPFVLRLPTILREQSSVERG